MKKLGYIKRFYTLNGEPTDIDSLCEHLRDLLENNGNTEMWNDFGIDFYDSDVLIECPYGGDETNDCEDCAYGCDYHFIDNECIKRDNNS